MSFWDQKNLPSLSLAVSHARAQLAGCVFIVLQVSGLDQSFVFGAVQVGFHPRIPSQSQKSSLLFSGSMMSRLRVPFRMMVWISESFNLHDCTMLSFFVEMLIVGPTNSSGLEGNEQAIRGNLDNA